MYDSQSSALLTSVSENAIEVLRGSFEGHEGAPLRIQGYVGEGYLEVGRGEVPARGDAGRRIEVEEKEVEFVRDSVITVPLASASVHVA